MKAKINKILIFEKIVIFRFYRTIIYLFNHQIESIGILKKPDIFEENRKILQKVDFFKIEGEKIQTEDNIVIYPVDHL